MEQAVHDVNVNPQQNLDVIIDRILTTRNQLLMKNVSRYPRRNNIASDLVDCDRYLTHARLDWDKVHMWDARAQAIMDAGKREEDAIKIELIKIGQIMGFQVTEDQSPINLQDIQLSGKIDGKLWFPHLRMKFPYEVKKVDQNAFERINDIEDFSKYWWMKKYPRQLLSYLLGHSSELGFFIITNGKGAWKILKMNLDWDEGDKLYKQLERVNTLVAKGEYGERNINEDLCAKCKFKHLCLPERNLGPGVQIEDDESLIELLKKREELKPLASEYDQVDSQIKKTVKNAGEKILVGDYLITNKEYERKTKVPITWEERKTAYTRTNIVNVKEKNIKS